MTNNEKIVYDEIMDMLLYYKMLGAITPTSGIEVENTAKRIVYLLKMEDERYRE